MKAEAYKAGHIESGNWTWAVGIPNENGHHSLIATINSFACWTGGCHLDPLRIATIMAYALNAEMEKTS